MLEGVTPEGVRVQLRRSHFPDTGGPMALAGVCERGVAWPLSNARSGWTTFCGNDVGRCMTLWRRLMDEERRGERPFIEDLGWHERDEVMRYMLRRNTPGKGRGALLMGEGAEQQRREDE